MSGIVGMINFDGAIVDRHLLQVMTEFLSYRGPDAQNIWIDGNVGFGHALLRTTEESLGEKQPCCSLDQEVWITGDVRIDGRKELIEKLKVDIAVETITDVELILYAYQVWGEDCVKYLLGDFAFAIWDQRKQRLFCARDHFGVKPFYYSAVGNSLIFSNTLNCVRIHPQVSDKLNDLAIADFLLFGYNQELDTTTFADIARLPPAHFLIWSHLGLKIEPYWRLPVDGYLRYQRKEEYVEHFKELMSIAVSDRLRTNSIAVSMSGGMDSTSIAATAGQVLKKGGKTFNLRAFTVIYEQLIPDQERYYSGLVAEALGMPIHYLVADGYNLFRQVEEPLLHRPEPVNFSLLAIVADRLQQIAGHSRVLLDGNGGDPVFLSWGAYFYFAHLLKSWRFDRLIRDTLGYVVSHHRLPQPGVRARLKQWLGIRRELPAIPSWLNSDFSAKLDLPGRWEQFHREKSLIHPIRPEAYQQLTSPAWPYLFEGYDPGVTRLPVEVRYPFFDLRLVNYLLAIPPVPWCLHKELMRVAMGGILPASICRRPKTPMLGDPTTVLLRQSGLHWLDQFEASPMLAKYIDCHKMPLIYGRVQKANEACISLQPFNLNHWLLHNYKLVKEEYYALP